MRRMAYSLHINCLRFSRVNAEDMAGVPRPTDVGLGESPSLLGTAPWGTSYDTIGCCYRLGVSIAEFYIHLFRNGLLATSGCHDHSRRGLQGFRYIRVGMAYKLAIPTRIYLNPCRPLLE